MNKLKDKFQYSLMLLSSLITFSFFGYILLFIILNGYRHISLTFIFSKDASQGILSMIVATLIIVVISVAVSVIIALATAIYLSEYAKDHFLKTIIIFSIDSLVSIPSIVYGLFGLAFFVGALQLKFSILSGALTISIMLLPVLISTILEALKTVGSDLKASSYALGANKSQTIFKVIIPEVRDNIFTGIILSIAKVLSESAPFILTAGVVAKMPKSIFSSARTLTTHMYLLISEGAEKNALQLAFASGTILIILIVLLNLSVNYIKTKMGGH